MNVRNREGEPVDPVPFAVVAGSAWLLCLSFGPLYLDAFAIPWPRGLAISTAIAFLTTVWAYRRYVWTVDPVVRREVPAKVRFRQICYGALVFGIVFLVLSVLVFARGA
ncbi:hypothetical protein [Halobellus marinus]|uniref:hypothetical protein n=1 Tax=Halobellus TaxID=1073986 RepID=UPI0028A8300B|nr:hypothetical protein [Halobellus sp. DFY28]